MALDTDFWIDLNKGESPIRVWDKLTLGGITFPGLCALECSVGLDLDVAKYQTRLAAGTQPAQFLIGLIDKGYSPGTIRAFLQIWEQDQWEDMKETLPKFSPRSGNKQGSSLGNGGVASASDANANSSGALGVNVSAQRSAGIKGRDAFDISHPTAALLGITSVIITKITIPPIIEQTMIVTMDMLQYFPQAGVRVLHSSGGSLNAKDFDTPNPGGNVVAQ